MRVALFLLAAATLFAADELKPVTETHTYDLAANGTIHILNAAGNLEIDAWDQPRVEVTVVKTAEEKKVMDQVKVSAETSGNTLTISTSYKKFPKIERPFRWSLNFDLEYRIQAPRNAKLEIDEYSGQVSVLGMASEIRVKDGNGDIFLNVPDGKYALHANTKIGEIISDFPGRQHRKALLFGYDFASENESGTKLDLKIGTGTVTVLKMRVPALTD